VNKGRAPRPVRRTGTEIHEDRRTRRQRARGDQERAVIESSATEDTDDDGRDWEFDYYSQAWDDMIGGDIE